MTIGFNSFQEVSSVFFTDKKFFDNNTSSTPLKFNNSLINFKGTILMSTNDIAFAKSVSNRIIEITPNGFIDSYLSFDEYIKDEKIIKQREKLYN